MGNISDKDLYFVAVKVFFEHDEKLLILKDSFGDWDLPGGRIKKDEFDVSLLQILERKISEELGGEIRYAVNKNPVVLMRHERVEAAPGNPTVRIFAVGYEGRIENGAIRLSKRHSEMKWVHLKNFKPEEYFKGGWLKGVQEYLQIKHS